MLDDLDPCELIEIEAATRLDPWGDGWEQTAVLEAKLHNVNCPDDPVNPIELIPNEDNRKVSDEMGPAEIAAAARSMAGL